MPSFDAAQLMADVAYYKNSHSSRFETCVVFCRDMNKLHFFQMLSLNQFRHALNHDFLEHLEPRTPIKLKVTEPIQGKGM